MAGMGSDRASRLYFQVFGSVYALDWLSGSVVWRFPDRTYLPATVAYAPRQEALGRWYINGAAAAAGVYTKPFAKDDNLYTAGDAAAAIPHTPFTLKAHIGRSHGQNGLGPNATAVSPTGTYWDWSLGVDTTYKNLTLTLAYVDTDIKTNSAEWRRLQPSFSKGQDGTGSIADATLLVMLTAAF